MTCRRIACVLAAAALAAASWCAPLRAADGRTLSCPPSRRPVDFSDSAGRISEEMLAAFRAMVAADPRTAPVTNAVTRNSVKDLTVDLRMVTAHDGAFSHPIKTGSVTDQRASGRCWLFAGFNILRPRILKQYNLADFEFSQNYSFFWDKLEKANLFLEGILRTLDRRLDDRHIAWLLKTPFPDGGQWNMVVDLVARYGLVPRDVMPDTKHSSGTAELNGIVSLLLRKNAARLRALNAEGKSLEELRGAKVAMLADIYRILCYHFGEPPAAFSWRYKSKDDKLSEMKTYTPKSFYREFVGVDLGEYLLFYSCPAHAFGRLYRIEFDRDVSDAKDMTFVNVPMETLKGMVLKQILAEEPVWFGSDVGQEHFRDSGILRPGIHAIGGLLGIDLGMTKAERVLYQASNPTHAMVLMGVDLAGDKPVKWRVENSWGAQRGDKGYLMMYDDWFDEYLYAALVHAKHVPEDIKALFDGEPVVLPPWDPMYDGLR